MVNFADLKKNRNSSFNKLNEQLSKMNQGGYSNEDEGKYWKPDVDKAGNGYAVLRFLPAPAGEDMPFVRMWGPWIPRTRWPMVYRKLSHYYRFARPGF